MPSTELGVVALARTVTEVPSTVKQALGQCHDARARRRLPADIEARGSSHAVFKPRISRSGRIPWFTRVLTQERSPGGNAGVRSRARAGRVPS